jgi:hypothetical protein
MNITPKVKWDTTQYKHHDTQARIKCLTCGWVSGWIRHRGATVAQAKADHRYTEHRR